MSTARVPSGIPTGGQFSATTKHEADLRLVTTPVPERPDHVALAAQWPNRPQRCDVLNERVFDYAVHPGVPVEDRVAETRRLVEEVFATHGRFHSLHEDDGAAASYVFDALGDDAKILAAIDASKDLSGYETRSFGNRVAGHLFDIETEERERVLVGRAIAEDPYVGFRPITDEDPPGPVER